MRADQHPQEVERLKSLRSYDILDTDAEAEFEDIVALASKICDVPVSLISLVDKDRQWFKARRGFEPSETPLDQSVCAHAILGESLFEISDLRADLRTRDNPLVTGGPEVQFYAGANLVTPEGLPLGTLCVLDTKPRQLTDLQREALQTLSQQVVAQLELRRKIRAEQELRSEMDHRVKNSLQTIASLLSISARQIRDDDAREVLDLVNRRIEAVASLHDALMLRHGSSTIPGQEYLDRVANFLRDILPAHITISVACDPVELTSGTASALGTIASEFVANASKYAFPNGREGQIDIRLETGANGQVTFSCADDGVGSTADADAAEGTGLGASIMAAAANQLNSTLLHEVGDRGARLSLNFRT